MERWKFWDIDRDHHKVQSGDLKLSLTLRDESMGSEWDLGTPVVHAVQFAEC
jgi:hypothetical protein